MKKLHFISRSVRENNTVASGFSSIKIHYSVNRINEVYVIFSINIALAYSAILLKNLKVIYGML